MYFDVIRQTDLVDALRDISDRWLAAPPIQDVDDRSFSLSSSVPHIFGVERSSSLPSDSDTFARQDRISSSVNKGRLRALRGLRNAELDKILENAERGLNAVRDDIAAGQANSWYSKYNIRRNIDLRLNNCYDHETARQLFASPLVELRGLPEEDMSHFLPISDADGRLIFGSARVQEHFADDEAEFRFSILHSVTAALAIAEQHGWSHRNLDAKHIAVRSNSSMAWSGDDERVVAKVLNFQSRTNIICVSRCTSCMEEVQRMRGAGELLAEGSCTSLSDVKNYSNPMKAWKTFSIDNGKQADAAALGAFMVQLYSGQEVEPYADPLGNEHADALAHVPWIMRFIFVDSQNLSASLTLTFLDALKSGKIRPYGRPSDLFPVDDPNQDVTSVLRNLTRRSLLAAARTGEAWAAFHLADLSEPPVESLRVCDTDTIKEQNMFAYFCFQCAGHLGDPEGFFNMARMQASWMRHRVQNIVVSVIEDFCSTEITGVAMLHLLLEAAVSRHSGAISALQYAAKHGVEDPSALFSVISGGSGAHGSIVTSCDEKLLEAVTRLGALMRRGAGGLPCDTETASLWFVAMHDRGYAPATLEYALLTRQLAWTKADIWKAVRLAKMVSTSEPRALFFLGWWHWHGVEVDEQTLLEKDPTLAAKYFKGAANAKDADGMAMYAQLLESGAGGLKTDKEEARKWLKWAIDKGSGIAVCNRAAKLSDEAKGYYDKYRTTRTQPGPNLQSQAAVDRTISCLNNAYQLLRDHTVSFRDLVDGTDDSLDIEVAERTMDPRPYLEASKLIARFGKTIWPGLMHREGQQRDMFRNELMRVGKSTLNVVKSLPQKGRWRRWRINFVDFDKIIFEDPMLERVATIISNVHPDPMLERVATIISNVPPSGPPPRRKESFGFFPS